MPTVFANSSPPLVELTPNRCQSSGWMGTCRCASLTSAVSPKVTSPLLAFSPMSLLRSGATGARALVTQVVDKVSVLSIKEHTSREDASWFLFVLCSKACDNQARCEINNQTSSLQVSQHKCDNDPLSVTRNFCMAQVGPLK